MADETEYSIEDIEGYEPSQPVAPPTAPPQPGVDDYDISDLAIHEGPISRKEALGVGAQQGLTLGYGPQIEAYRMAYDDLLKQGKIKPPQFQMPVGIGAPPVILPMAEPQGEYDRSVISSPEYQFYLAQERNKISKARQNYPYTTFGGEVAGSTANPATWLFPELKAGQTIGNILRTALPSSVSGFIYGTSEGNTAQEKLEKGAEQAAISGIIGGGAGAIASPFVKGRGTAPEGLKEASETLSKTEPIVELPRGMTGSQWQRNFAAAFADLPFLRGRINKAAEKTSQQLSDKMTEISGNVDAYNAGSAAQDAMANWVVSSKKDINAAYTAADQLISPTPVPLSNTQKTLSDIVGERTRAFGPGSATGVRRYNPYTGLDFINTPLQDPAGKTYGDIKLLRTKVGEMLRNATPDTGVGELKRLYKSLTEDLEEAAKVGGGQVGYDQWKKANDRVRGFENALETVEGYFGKIDVDPRTGNAVFERNPEKFTKAITSAAQGKSQNLDKLVIAKSVMDPKSWDLVSQAAIADLGKEGQGATATFDPVKFIKQYDSTSGFSPRAKDVLFGATGTPLRDNLDAIATISRDFDQIKALKSKGAPLAGGLTELAVFTVRPLEALGAMVGSAPLAYYLSRPDTARSATNFAKAYTLLAKNPGSQAAQLAAAQAIKNMPMVAGANTDREQLLNIFAGIGVASGPVVDAIQSINPLNQIINAVPAERASGGRVARKAGGRIKTNPISAEVKRVRTLLSQKTANMLSLPDDAIATALHIAKRT